MNLSAWFPPAPSAAAPPAPAATRPAGGPGLRFRRERRDCVILPALAYAGEHPITIEAWVAAGDGGHTVVGNQEWGGLGLVSEAGRWQFVVHDKSAYRKAWSDGPAVPGQLVHLAGVYDTAAGEARLYVDGKRQSASTPVDGHRATKLPFMIGANPNKHAEAEYCFSGAVRAVRFSTSARYTDNFDPPQRFRADEDTWALYQLDEGQGKIAHDSSHFGLDGVVRGAEWGMEEPPP